MAGRSQQEDDGIVRCACNGKEEHESFIRCDKCFVWQHIVCMGVKEKNLHKKYYCERCSPSSHTIERGTSRRRFEIKIEEVERIKALETKRSRSLTLSLSANKSSPKHPRKYNCSSSKNPSFSRKIIVSDSDDSSCSSSPTPDFNTKSGVKSNRLSYEKYSTDLYCEEQENRESTIISSKEVSPSRQPKSSSELSTTSEDEYCSPESQNSSHSLSPIGSPIQLLPPMQNWIAFSSMVPLSTEVLDPTSPIHSPVIPPADFPLSSLFTEDQVSPLRPRNVHGRMSVREAVRRAEVMKKQILDFQANLEEKPELVGAFQDSSRSADKLLQDIKHFTKRFGN